MAATYLTALGKRCAAGVASRGEGSGSSGATPTLATTTTAATTSTPLAPADADALRLFANAYALHITHLTTGTRVGAAATEALALFPRRATALYDSYAGLPPAAGPLADPLRVFRGRVDGVGALVPAAGWAVLEAELVGAVQRAGGLYEAVARDD